MTEVRPAYYAAGRYRYEFELIGRGFDNLPVDVVGVPMIANDNPLQFRNETSQQVVMHMVERSNTRIVMQSSEEYGHATASIGGLLSSDRSIVYWENDMNPLP